MNIQEISPYGQALASHLVLVGGGQKRHLALWTAFRAIHRNGGGSDLIGLLTVVVATLAKVSFC